MVNGDWAFLLQAINAKATIIILVIFISVYFNSEVIQFYSKAITAHVNYADLGLK
jgi:hypothetical protein